MAIARLAPTHTLSPVASSTDRARGLAQALIQTAIQALIQTAIQALIQTVIQTAKRSSSPYGDPSSSC